MERAPKSAQLREGQKPFDRSSEPPRGAPSLNLGMSAPLRSELEETNCEECRAPSGRRLRLAPHRSLALILRARQTHFVSGRARLLTAGLSQHFILIELNSGS